MSPSSSIARRLTARVSVRFGDSSWPLLFTHDVLLAIEEESGLNILKGELDMHRPSAKALRIVLCIALRGAGAVCSLTDAGKILGSTSAIATRNAITRAWAAAMPVPDTTEAGKTSQIESWTEAWAIARYDLQMSSDEWLSVTPRMVQALSQQRLEDIRQRELMQSKGIAAAANFGARGPKEPFEEDAFMLHPYPNRRGGKPERIDGIYIMRANRSPLLRNL